MEKLINYFSRVLVALLLCTGVVATSCEGADPFGGENTEQDGGGNDDNQGGEDTGEGSDMITITSGGVTLTVSLRNLTETGVAFYGTVELAENYTAHSVGILYSVQETFTAATATSIQIVDIYGANYSVSTSSLKPSTTYYYTSYIKQGDLYKYGEIKSFVTASLVAPTLDVASGITVVSATIGGTVSLACGTADDLEYGFQYCTSVDFASNVTTKKVTELDSENKFSVQIASLVPTTTYYYRSYIKMNGVYVYGEVKEFTTELPIVPSGYTNLAATTSANCYIVSQSGSYCFPVVRGNASSDWLYQTKASEVLWESFGTSVTPFVGSLIKSASYNDGYITFQTADVFKEGNAVIAAKDAAGNILWSWHIWLTDQPQGQVYYNGAGTMMDRNLGATSATPGDVGALGLLYQWGRKDPFLGSSSISSNTVAKSTISWPSPVSTSSSRGTVSYVTANPTTFVEASSSPYDWHYFSRDNTLWTTSDKTKSIYDPCPAGWRVPDGGDDGVWSKALGSSSYFTNSSLYNSTKEGMNFSGKFGSASTIWYPVSGYRNYIDGGLNYVGSSGYYWSASPNSSSACNLRFTNLGYVYPSNSGNRAFGYSVRCLQE